VPENGPPAVAPGFTCTAQEPPLAIVDEPLEQVVPLSKVKLVVFDSASEKTEDV
jgi:hypothetical protein